MNAKCIRCCQQCTECSANCANCARQRQVSIWDVKFFFLLFFYDQEDHSVHSTLEGSRFVSVSLVLALFYQLQGELKALDVKLLKTEAGKELYKKVLEGCTNRGAQILDDHVFVATFCDPRFNWLAKEMLDTSDSHKTLSQMLLARMTTIQTQIQAEESKSKMAQQALQSLSVNAPVPPSSTAGLGLLERFQKHQEKSSVQENMVTVACLDLHARGGSHFLLFITMY